MKRYLISLVVISGILVGCSDSEQSEQGHAADEAKVESSQHENHEDVGLEENYFTFMDDLGREIVLEEKPERVIMLTPSFLDMFYQVGGQVVGAPTIPPHLEMDELREKIEDIPDLGHFAQNIEAVMDLQPDLVIGYPRLHDDKIDIFEQSKIPFAIMRTTTYEDTFKTWKLFADITGEPEKAEELTAELEKAMEGAKTAVSQDAPTVAILEVTARDVTLERDNSITGNMIKHLGINNIVDGIPAMEGRPDKVPFSMEALIEKDPDLILFKTMGPMENLQETFERELEGNPAWANVRAVKNDNIEYLPQELFLVHPGSKYKESLHYLISIINEFEE